jgi:hypothetical protein
MDGACSTHAEMKNAYRISVGKPEEKRPLGDLGVDGRTLGESCRNRIDF